MDPRPVSDITPPPVAPAVQWPPSTADLEGARQGDQTALAGVLRNTFPKLVGFFVAAGSGRQDASDLAGEVLITISDNIKKLRDVGAYRSWVWRIAHSEHSKWRRESRRHTQIGATRMRDLVNEPDSIVVLMEEHSAIRHAFLGLPPKDQILLWLRHVEGLSYQEIAREHSRAGVGALRVAMHRARNRLVAGYQREIGETGRK